ncbi:MAG: hypothetical protein V1809_01630 [Planctomycetota bacterium]
MNGRESHAAFCGNSVCGGCSVEGRFTCRQNFGDVVDFMAPATLYFLPAIGGMIAGGWGQALAIWGALAAAFFLYVQQKLVCCRCPHYAGSKPFLTCHAAFGLPKFPRYSPRPLGRAGRIFLYAYSAVLFLWPFPLLAMSGQWLLFSVTGGALLSWVWFVQRRLCTRCINLFCPFNRVPQPLRNTLAGMGPTLAAAREPGAG